MGIVSANRSGRRIPGGLASVRVSDMPTSTVIDYDRTYLVGRGTLRFSGVAVRSGEALTAEQLRSIPRPESYLSTGRIYPAPADWAPPDEMVSEAPAAAAGPASPAELEQAAQEFAEGDGLHAPGATPASLPPKAAENPVAAQEPLPGSGVASGDPGAAALAQALAEAQAEDLDEEILDEEDEGDL